jgi:hypothetical protein
LQYRIAVYNAQGKLQFQFGRTVEPAHRGPRALALAVDAYREASLITSRGSLQTLPPRAQARLDTMAREVIPHFSRHGLHLDSTGRIWVVGTVGDSTFVDVFSDSVFLGRRVLPCFMPGRGIALTGQWLLLRCESYLDDTQPPSLQLYEIRETRASPKGGFQRDEIE